MLKFELTMSESTRVITFNDGHAMRFYNSCQVGSLRKLAGLGEIVSESRFK